MMNIIINKYLIVIYVYTMSFNRMFGKLESGGHRFYDKMKTGGNRLYSKVRSQVIDNPRVLHNISKGLEDVGNYSGKGLKVGAGLAFGLGQPEVGAVLSAATAASGALGHAAHLVNDRVNYLERAKRKEESNPQQFA